jgi:hypothetical protein
MYVVSFIMHLQSHHAADMDSIDLKKAKQSLMVWSYKTVNKVYRLLPKLFWKPNTEKPSFSYIYGNIV